MPINLDHSNNISRTIATNATGFNLGKVTVTSPESGSTLTIADGKTLTASNSVLFSGTDGSTISYGTGGTVAYLGTAQTFTADQSFNKRITRAGSYSDVAPGVDGASGVFLAMTGATVTDTSSAAASVITNRSGLSINGPTLASTNSTTITNAATLWINSAVQSGTNTTITNAYSLYVNSGSSFFGGKVDVSANTPTPALTITQTGTGNVFEVQDSDNPDATPFVINTNGNITIGTRVEQTVGITPFTPKLQIAGTDADTSSLLISRFAANDLGPRLVFSKSRIGTIGNYTPVLQTADNMGEIYFSGSNGGTTAVVGAQIIVEAGETWTSTSTPGTIKFATVRSGTTTPVDTVKIYPSGVVGYAEPIIIGSAADGNVASETVALYAPITIGSLSITNAGAGYRNGVHVVNIGEEAGEDGFGARVALSVGGGIIRAVNVENGGYGYVSGAALIAPTILTTIPGTVSGNGTTATITYAAQQSTNTITSISGNGTTATVTLADLAIPRDYNPYPVGSSVTITGNANAGFNGTFTVVSTPTVNTFTFSSTTNAANQAGGSVSIIPFTVGGRITVTGFANAGFNVTDAIVTASTATTVSYDNATNATSTGGSVRQGTATTIGTVTIGSVVQSGLTLAGSMSAGAPNRIRFDYTISNIGANQTLSEITTSTRDTSITGTIGDVTSILSRATSAFGGGYLIFRASADDGMAPEDVLQIRKAEVRAVNSRITRLGDVISAAPSVGNGVLLTLGDATQPNYVDTSSAGGATINTRSVASINTTTLKSVNNITVNNAASLFIPSAPVAGTGTTFNNSYALLVNSGTSRFSNTEIVGNSLITANNIINGNIRIGTGITGTEVDVIPARLTSATKSIVAGTSDNTSSAMQSNYGNNAIGPILFFTKSRSTTLGSLASPVISLTSLGTISFQGANGTSLLEGAYIDAVANETFTTTSAASSILFGVTRFNSTTPITSFRINNDGSTQSIAPILIGNVPGSATVIASSDLIFSSGITNLTFTSGGTGYRDGSHLTSIVSTTGSGTLAQAYVYVGGGIVRSIEVTNTGRAYRGTDTLTIPGTLGTALSATASGNGTTATLTFAAQQSLSITSVTTTGTTATLKFVEQLFIPYPVGSTITVTGATPAGVNGTFTVTASTKGSVTYSNNTAAQAENASTGTISIHPFVVGARITVSGFANAGFNATNVSVTASTATTVSYSNTTNATSAGGTVTQGTALTTITGVTQSVNPSGMHILHSNATTNTDPGFNRIRLENTASAITANQEIGSIMFTTRDTTAGATGDISEIACFAESSNGGGRIELMPARTGFMPTPMFVVSATNGFGYATGTGGTALQFTSRTTGVTLNKPNGQITLFNTTTTAGQVTTFTVTNNTVTATSNVIVTLQSGGAGYMVYVSGVSAGSFNISVYTPTAQAAAAPVINFAVINSVNS